MRENFAYPLCQPLPLESAARIFPFSRHETKTISGENYSFCLGKADFLRQRTAVAIMPSGVYVAAAVCTSSRETGAIVTAEK